MSVRASLSNLLGLDEDIWISQLNSSKCNCTRTHTLIKMCLLRSPIRFVSWSGTTRDEAISEYRQGGNESPERGNTRVRKEGNMKQEVKLQVSQAQEGKHPFHVL